MNWIFSLKPLVLSALLYAGTALSKYSLESFIKRIRWKTFLFERQGKDNDEITTNFRFKSVKTPPKKWELGSISKWLVQYSPQYWVQIGKI